MGATKKLNNVEPMEGPKRLTVVPTDELTLYGAGNGGASGHGAKKGGIIGNQSNPASFYLCKSRETVSRTPRNR